MKKKVLFLATLAVVLATTMGLFCIKNSVKETGTATEIELKNGIRTINGNAYNSGTFDGGSYSNIDTELIPYVELNMSGFSSVNSTTPATARLFIDNPDWTGKSYTSEFWVKSYYENIATCIHFSLPVPLIVFLFVSLVPKYHISSALNLLR